ncbi:E3 ubiquitin-protein ligase RMND5A [Harmonia axyridis]|uniref:E3 ubiquitin-protein ligase RMND5A n=1 Tax=Harmonia axyridis TaxID=115357 RepID=UPI001E27951D|nr:E3 ubiquitin-protein ligase RMND5A [Harmonia axyridis]
MSNKLDSFSLSSGMEACLSLERELNKLLVRFEGIKDIGHNLLDTAISDIKTLQDDLGNVPEDQFLSSEQVERVKSVMMKVKSSLAKFGGEHRELHSALSKYGKLIDRNFVADYAATSRPNIFNHPDKVGLINKIICQHYHRQGMHDVAEALAEETDVQYEFTEKESFGELNHILDCLRNKDLEPALVWATAHSQALDNINSSLEFKLHRLKYIELLSKGTNYQADAITYARNHFRKFVKQHEKDIQVLMGMLLYIPNGINTSPYSCLVSEELWLDTYELFTREACQLMGITVHSPLAICLNAGCSAIPALLNIKQVMMQRQVGPMWNGKDELPIEIDLGPDSRYHSMFACPILRQQSTKGNPPMRLVCGHVISRDALSKLCNGNKMKCPYCPMEQSPGDARFVIF